MTHARGVAVTTVESSPEQPAPHYIARSPIAQLLDSEEARAQIMPLVPHGTDWQQVLLEVHRAAIDNPGILRCTPSSIIRAVGTAVQTGLTIGRTIHLVPVNTRVGQSGQHEMRLHAWPDYRGDIELVLWSGAARDVYAAAVRQRDTFDFQLGDEPWVKHTWPLGADRGPIVAGYAIARLDGYGRRKRVVIMDIAEIEAIRRGSKQWSPDKVRECPAWYVEKTLYHRICKALPKSRRLATVLAMLDAREQHERGEEPVVDDDADTSVSPAMDAAISAPPPSTGPGAFPLPFTSRAGTPIGELPHEDLVQCLDWAKRQTRADRQYPAFIEAAEALLEQRRWQSEESAL